MLSLYTVPVRRLLDLGVEWKTGGNSSSSSLISTKQAKKIKQVLKSLQYYFLEKVLLQVRINIQWIRMEKIIYLLVVSLLWW